MPHFATTVGLNSPKVGPKSPLALCGQSREECDRDRWLPHPLNKPSSNAPHLLDEITNYMT